MEVGKGIKHLHKSYHYFFDTFDCEHFKTALQKKMTLIVYLIFIF